MEPAAGAGPHHQKPSHPGATPTPPWSSCVSATAASLVAVGLGGAALLVWWALAFHPAHARLWMVPAGLVLLGTPVMAWLSLFASDLCGRRQAPPSPPAAGGYASPA
ncbi:hypothetical protein PR202_gb14617 [Eleusine coracana subsp. coracana]|uniref:Transmembrane protein n=1 Tax=Eleusine coracana subsp. coracana TaxID=191504 RepID=A0AAV5ETF0_ELECO|nr:hypothetical protein QOZ80_4BG0337650 [Eleusine coracana subsp. coracana]GJN26668.1 hypothetical protein PR202_gb14617 [Eleusine coracana subsp. coracana]